MANRVAPRLKRLNLFVAIAACLKINVQSSLVDGDFLQVVPPSWLWPSPS
jgi:hypothetical protein